MPIYNFACEQCGKQFEEIVSFERRQDVTCPDCQGKTRVQVASFAVKAAKAAAAPSGSPFS